jgi:hypothetical protein
VCTRLRFLLVLIVTSALAGCASPPSPQEIKMQLGDLPGVVTVSTALEGDDDLPFGDGPMYVRVVMARDATADEVLGVLDLLDEELDEDEIENIELGMAGPKAAGLTTGDLRDRERLAADLVAAYRDPEVLSYVYFQGFDVSVRVASADMAHVVAAADRYGIAGDPDEVFVVGGKFELLRGLDDDKALLDARTRFVLRLEKEFPLTGAVVSGGARPMELWTTRKDRDALRALVAKEPEARGLGVVVVRTASIPGS